MSASVDSASKDAPSTLVDGRYQVGEPIATAEGRRVYAAHDLRLARDVTLTVATAGAGRHAEQLERSAQIAGQLAGSTNIWTLFDTGVDGDCPYMVGEPLRGVSARALCDEETARPPVEFVVRVGTDVCRALQAVHGHGYAHLNVVPESVWLDADGGAQLGGFEFASHCGEAIDDPGLPGYVAPELLSGCPVSEHCDQFSLGILMYELLTGELPFDPQGHSEPERAFGEFSPPSDYHSEVTPELDSLIATLLAEKPEERFPDISTVSDALRSTIEASPVTLAKLVSAGESERLEFKSSLRYAHDWAGPEEHRDKEIPKLELAVCKAIAALANTKGGTLVVGTNDEGIHLGIEPDFATIGRKQDKDGWWLALKQALVNKLGSQVMPLLDVHFVSVDSATTVVVIRVKASREGVWLRDGDHYKFYVRQGPSSVELIPPDAVEYLHGRAPL
jgi:serine/threonine protein kinase